MTNDDFWDHINETRLTCANQDDSKEHALRLKDRLSGLQSDEVLAFVRIFKQQMWRVYGWDLWAVAYVALGGCSDSGFEEFRAWLISRGKQTFENAIENPLSVAPIVKTLSPDYNPIQQCEEFLLTPTQAYKTMTGKHPYEELPEAVYTYDERRPFGTEWDETKICTSYPEVCSLFGRTNRDFL